ncbi:MAG: DUF4388 domain-containing protein, partial [Polyangiaceae bacterium]
MTAAPPAAKSSALLTGNDVSAGEPLTARRTMKLDPSRVRVLEGSLSDFDVPTLLQTVNLGRQLLLLEVLEERRLVGAICVKAGMVLHATAGHLTGTAAVQRLIESSPTGRFVMWRLCGEVDDVHPLGSVPSTLMRAAVASDLAANARR